MHKVLKYGITALISIGAIILISKFVQGSFKNGIKSYSDSINADVEAKREALISTGVFLDGVTVNGVSLGGMSYEEAKEALRPVEKEMVKGVGYSIRFNDEKLKIGRDYFDISYNTEKILKEAILLATEGELESIRHQIDDIAKNGREYEIECTVKADKERIESAIREFGEPYNKSAENAKVNVLPDSVYNGGERFEYQAGKKGYRVLTDDAVEKVFAMIDAQEYGTVKMKGEVVEPKIKLADIKDTIVLRSHYESSYAMAPYNYENRVFNIEKACALVNGYVLPPKKSENSKKHIFSINKTLGDRTEELGWLLAPGFTNGGAKSVDSPGGGVCHVSSTLYNAVVRADLKIVSRMNHSAHVGYVPWGLDATIFTGGTDFKFANNTKNNIYVFMWVNSKKKTVCCEIWGDPFPETFDSIDFYAELVEEVEPSETEYRETSKLEEPYWYVDNYAKTGYKYQSYKQYYLNGEPVGDPRPVAVSVYRMHPMRICVWKGFDPNVDMLLRENRIEPESLDPTPEPEAEPSPTPAP